jgi:hypothetical protein
MVVTHFTSVQESLEVFGGYETSFVHPEMIDDTILNCTKQTKNRKNRFFIQGEPKVMMFEAASHTSMEDAEMQADALIKDLEENNFMLRQNYNGADIEK